MAAGRCSTMHENVHRVAKNLEMFGTSRADFRQLSDDDRQRVAKRVAIHLAHPNTPRNEARHIFFHITGEVGIKFKEARNMWRTSTETMSWDDVPELDDN